MNAVWHVLLCLAAYGATQGDAPPPQPIDAPVLVQFDSREIAKLGCDGAFDCICARAIDALELPENTDLRETTIARMLREQQGGDVDFSRWMLIILRLMPGEQDRLDDIVARLYYSPLVRYAEPDYDAFGWKSPGEPAVAARADEDALVPDDPLFPLQYYHRQIQTPRAWRITTGSQDVTVAVLDTGCNANIKDLQGRVLPGYDFVDDSPDSTDAAGHGTSIAALIAATGNNTAGIAGIDWHCQILPIKAAEGGVAVWVQAIDFAVRAGARVINISGRLALPSPSPLLDDAFARAVDAGVVIVVSAGNQKQSHLAWPASSPHVISVGATDDDRLWSDPVYNIGSNRGPGLDLVAPGRNIVSIGPDDKKTTGEGTSCSAALVSGACALMCAVNPALHPAQIRRILHETADKIGPPGSYKKGYSQTYGYGRLNVYKAVLKARNLDKKNR